MRRENSSAIAGITAMGDERRKSRLREGGKPAGLADQPYLWRKREAVESWRHHIPVVQANEG